MKSSGIKIYVVGHDRAETPNNSAFVPIQVGAYDSILNVCPLKDDVGDNISALNQFYAEMTAMYWVWKNTQGQSHVGFFHYRRYLNFGEPFDTDLHWSEQCFYDFSPDTIARMGWDEKTIGEVCKNYDIVIPTKETVLDPYDWQHSDTLYNHYCGLHVRRDVDLAIELAKAHPLTADVVDKVFRRKNGIFTHMYVMRRDIFDEYMDWIFGITREMEKRIDLSFPFYAKGAPQSRVFGFLGERLLNVYIEAKSQDPDVRIGRFQRLFGKLNTPVGNVSPLKLIAKSARKAVRTRKYFAGGEVEILGVKFGARKPY